MEPARGETSVPEARWPMAGAIASAMLLTALLPDDVRLGQQLNPTIGPRNWRPRFVDYVYLSVTNSMAFSPTDVMPLVPWAKLSMAVQAVISLGILGLVIARAVNVFS